MKKKFRVTLVLTLVLLTLGIQVLPASAFVTWGANYKLINGIHNQYSWYDSTTIDSTVHSYITSARNDWNNTPTHVWFIEVADKSSSVMDIYRGNYFPASYGYAAMTHFFVGNPPEIDPTLQNYGWTRIELNAVTFDTLSTSGLNLKRAVIAHEMGHALGLAHNSSNVNVLMYPYINSWTVNGPTQDEINGMNFLYP